MYLYCKVDSIAVFLFTNRETAMLSIVKHSAWCQCNGAKAALILPAVILITKQLLTDLTRDDADTGYWRQNLDVCLGFANE